MLYHTVKPGTPPAKKPRLFRVAYLSPIWLAATICVLLFTAYPANANLALDTPPDQNYTQSRVITNLILPAGTDGAGTLVYTLRGSLSNPSLPTGLRFDPGTRTLSGTPSTVSVTTLTYTVTDGNDASTSATFTVTVNPRLTLSHPVQLSFTQGRAINDDHPILPGAMGGTAPLVYTLTDLPPGLEFDPNTRRLSGTPGTFDRLDPPRSRLVGSPPNQTALYIVIYGVTDANGASARTSTTSEFLSIAISANLTLDGSVPDQNYTEGRPVTLQLPEATGGFGPLTYTLTAPGGLPEGLIFTPETRTLSGALVRQGLPKTLTYKVTDDNDASTSAAFTVTGKAKVALNTPTKRSYTRGTAINVDHPILPGAIAGTEPLTYTLTALGGGALPVGLEFDPNTRRLSGTPDDIPGDFVLTYMVTDANGSSDNVGFRVAINPGLMLTAPANLNYTLDTEIPDLQLPAATGGTGTLVYTLTGPGGLPGGLNFTAGTRTLSGTPDTAGTTTLTYTVTDRNNANTSVTITVMVNPGLALNARGDLNYTQGRAITNLQLPEATGGTGTLGYTLTGPSGLPAGLNFNAETRTLSGTPSTADTFDLTYEVTDANGDSTSVDFRITVNAGLTLIALDDLNYTLDTEIDRLQLPEATGGTAPLVYTLTDLRPNLRFQASTRTLFGRAISTGTTTLTYTVTDANGDSTSMDFTVTVNPGLAPLTAPADQNYTQDNEIDSLPLPVATGGTAPLVYTLTDLPAGLAFNPQTRTLSGTPDTDGDFTLTYEVSDANGANTSVTFMVTVNDGLTLTAPADQNYTLDTEIDRLQLPEATGGRAPLVYTLTSVPGLEFDADTRILSGTPSTATNTTTLTYTVTDTNNASTSVTFTVRVNASLGLDTPDDQNYTRGTAILGLTLPAATGGTAPLAYTLAGPGGLPGGLGFDANTRTLSGTPSMFISATLTYTVTDANDATTSVDFTVIVSDGLALTASGNQNYTQGTAITNLELPVATGGTGTLTYTLTSVPGLTFTPGTRTLSGTPSTPGDFTLTYEVTDDNGGSANATFTVTVNAGLALTASGDQDYTLDTAITNLTLPEASGGTAPLTYTLTGPGDSALPGGLTFTPGTRTLSGTPSTAGTFDLTYEVTDDNDASTSVDFTVMVNASLTLSAPGNQIYTQNTAIPNLTLPAATGGTAPLTYTLVGPRGVPEGLAFNPQTRTLSGTPSAIDDTMLTYTVTDTNGASTSVDLRIFINSNLAFVSEPANQNYTQDIAINTQLPEATGGTGTFAYTLIGQSRASLPPGLIFTLGTRTLSGTPSMTGTTALVYSAQDTGDSSIISVGSIFTVTVNPGLEPLTAPDDQNYTQGTKIDDLQLPAATGGTAPLTYTLTGRSNSDPSLPTGLSFDPSTRILSGTPSTATGTPTEFGNTELLYSVTDANGDSTSVDFRVTVNLRLALTAPDDQNYTLDTAITDLPLPAATGGTAPLTYTLTNVPGGLNFDPSTRILSGTPKDIIGNFDLTYKVTDTNNASASVDFMVTISNGLAFVNELVNQNYTQGTKIDDLQLPAATGGTGTLTYTLTGPATNRDLPPGLIFDPVTRTLSGTPTELGETRIVYTVTDPRDSGRPTQFGRIFLVTVNPGLAPLTAPDDQNYTQGTKIDDLPLPEATGGTGTLTYTLTGVPSLPPGLTFTAGTRILSGTPSTAGTTTLTYEVTDTNGASTSVDFTVSVNAGLALTASGNQNYTRGTAISNLILPAATGGTMPLTYTLTNVPGLTFDPNTRTLSGTPSTADTTTLTYTVTDTNGGSANATFTVTVNAGLALTASGDQDYTLDTAITALTLPPATGGTGTLTYTLTSVPGLTFDPNTRTLSGTPSTADTTTLTYTVTDTNGDSANATFTVTVNADLALTASGDQNYTLDTAITALTLPEATGGTMPLTYTLTSVPGLTFDPNTRTLSGTPSTADTTTLTYTVTDTNGDSANATFTVTVNADLALTAPANQNYTRGTEITGLELPEATGGTMPLTYTLTSVPGLDFDPGTRTLSGTPSTADTTTLTYTVTDTNGDSANATFTVTVNADLALTASGDQNYTQDTAITALQLPIAGGGTAPLTYTLTGPSGLPTGLTFNAGTRTLSGTPSTADTTTLTYTVTDTNGDSANATFTVTVNADLALTASGDQNYTQDTAITALQLPIAGGGTAPLTYTLTGPSGLPTGLTFNAGTRTLSGTPSTADTTTLTYEVMDANGASTNATFTVSVSDGLALTASGDQNYTQGTAITVQLPEATGGTGTLTYTLTSVPGLTFTPGTRTLSGTPSTAGTTTLTYRVTDANGASTSVDFTVTVSSNLALDTPANQNYTQGKAISNLQLPVATGGTAPLTYTLTRISGGILPAGLTFNTRTLSGTPNTPSTTTLTYRVIDAIGTARQTQFTVTVNASLTLTASGNQNYTRGTEITGLELPVATGGTGKLTYTLTGPSGLPTGLTFNAGTRTLSGTPSTADTTTLTYTVTDTNGDSANATFTVIVSGGLVLTASGDQNYTLDTLIPNLELPAATGGTGTLTYTLTGPGAGNLPAGLSFDAGTRTLSGTPSTAGTTELTYEVIDANGASTSVDFMVIVSDGLALTASGNQNYTLDTEIDDLQLPAATGGTMPLTYTLTGPGGGNLPAGLNFTPGTRTLSGTPGTANATTLTYRVTDTNGASMNATFTVIVSDGLALTASGNQNYTQGRAITGLELPIATGGTAPLTYTLTGPGDSALPGGLTFTPGTRTLSGTPNTAGTTTLTYAVTDTNGASTNATFTVIVSDGLVLTASGNQNYTLDTLIPNLELPIATGGTVPLTYTLTGPSGGNLPAGLNFNAGTRMLSGTPNTAGTTTLTYRVTDTNGASTNATFTVIVSDGLVLTASDDQNYTLDTLITALQLPVATGGTGTLVYTLTGPGGLPGGLNFTAGTRTLSGTPNTAGNFTLTYAVTDANGASTSVDFMVIVSDGLALTASGNQNYTLDTLITALQLPVATGGTAPLTYTLAGPSGGNLPAGLTFTPGTRMLSGTPSTAGTTTLTYAVTDANGASTSVDFMVIVSDGLALTASGNQNYTLDTLITALELPIATGGTGTLVYTLTGPGGGNLPAGLNFTPGTRMLSGTPNTAGTTTLTYEVTDTNGASTNATFMVIVSDGLVLSARGNQNYTLDTLITALELPIATGGTGTLTYTLTGPSGGNLPAGLNFNVGTRTLSGTPNTAGTTTLTYEVTDDNGASTSVDFMVIVSDGLALTASGNQNYTLDTLITALELPIATGGTAPLTYTLTGPSGGNLPAGLSFDPGTRTLSGTPSTAGTTELTYEVSDTNGASTSVNFTVIVSDGLALNARGNQNYTRGTAINNLQLPAATGGTGTLQYTLTGPSGGNLPAGLTFTPGTRMLSGTPNTAGTTTLTYAVTDTNGASTNATFTVIVSDGLALTASGNQNYTLDTLITALELPEATGGTGTLQYTLTGPGGGNLPAGLNFTAGTRTLSGTPGTAGITLLTYRVTDTNGASTSVDFTVIVSDGLALSARGDQNYTRGTAIGDLQLPAATGGTGTLTYTLTGPGGGNLPAGLNFTAGTRTLSGTPGTAGTTTLTYRVTDTNGASTSVDFTVIVSDGLALTASANQNYTLDTAIDDLQLPAATGGTAPLTYTLTGPGGGNLPAGLSFDPGTRTLSGTPSTAGITVLTYRATDANGASTSVDFTVMVSDGLALSARGDQNYTRGTAIGDLQLPAATGGTAPLTYTLTGPSGGNLPAGLNFDPGTRTLSGTPSTAGTTTLTYEVTDANNASTSVDFTVMVSDGLALSARGDQNYTRGTAIGDLQLPAATGGTGTLTYTLTGPGGGNLPAGLNFTAGTRTLSGTPGTAGTTTLTYRVTDTNGASTSVDFTVIVSDGLALAASANQNYTLDTAIDDLQLPAATGGTAPLTYTLTGPGGGNLPAGLNFTAGTRTLSGTPSTAGITLLTYRATDANGASTSVDFTVMVSDGLALSARGDQNYTRGTAIGDLQLPVATGGTAPLTYTLAGPSGGNLPAGLTFTPGTRMLSGTPSTAGTTTLTYAVTDANNASTSVDFMVIVSDGLALTASGNQNYTLDTLIPNLELPIATGGTGTLVYTLTGPGGGNLPAGLNFTPGTRMLSGTPNTAGTTTLTYEVTDTNGASTNATFMVIVSDGLVLSARGNQNYTLDTLITALELPIATGGTGTLTYTLTGPSGGNLPAGLNFNVGTRTLSGTPNTAGTTTLTYEVTDDNGASTSVNFTVIVSDGLALTASGNQNYTLDTLITALELPIATGGTAPLTYTLTGPSGGNLPAGLSFDPGTRTLSGTPSTAGTTELTYEVSDTNGASTSVNFTVIVSDGLALNARGNQNYTRGTAITDLQLPAATGGTGTLQYTLTGPSDSALPAGLTFTPGTRTLSGTPSTAGTTTLTYEVTDANNASTSVDFTVMVSDGLALSARGDQNYTRGTAIGDLQLPAATGGTGTLTYTLTGPGGGNLPAGLNFTAGTRTLSGTPGTAGTTTLTYRVTDTNGASTSVDFTVIVSDGLALAASANQNYTLDTAITALQLPAATGGTGTLTYTLTGPSGGNLPAGLNFNVGTRILSGTPSTAGTTTLTYAVSDANGASTDVTFTVIVNASLTLTASGNQNYTLDTAITALQLPAATGGTAPLTYTLTSVPGLNFNAGTRILSGTPTTAGTTTLTYAVSDTNGASTSVNFTVIVSDGLALTAPVDQNYTLDTLITALQLPAATGGTGTLTYTLTSVPGLDFNVGTRILSGTPSTAGTTTLTYAVTDANNASTNATFTVTVNAGLTLTASGNQNYTLDTAITALQLPAATGGTAPLTYTLTSVPGLTFTPGTRTLSGTPSTAGTTTLTYAVSDANNASQLAIFTIAVADEVEVTAPNNQTYTMNTAITNLTLPEATGGTTPLTYTLTPLPDGLTFTTGTRVLSGTPTTANTTVLTYTATDDNGSTAMDTFTLTVEGTDASPAFVETTFSQAENATPTLTLAATEADGDDVSFVLQSGRDAAYFTLTDGGVSADTAALVFRRAPNFENPQSTTLLPGDASAKNTYQINVRAASTTSPNAEQTITQIITINVTDVDDPPTFTTAADALMIMEGETALVAMIEVIDQDGDPVTLALTGGADQARLRLTGSALSFIRAPDFENAGDADANNIYAIEITAISTSTTTTTGTGAIVLSAVRTFNITVTDADDNAPEFTSPTAFQIQSGETAVATLEATDADAGDTETIVFALSGGADQTQFSLTSAGVLSFTSAADFAEPTDADADNIYAIEITLTSGSRPHVTEVALEIEVINIDRQSRQRIGNVILAHIARNLADNTQDVISARTSDRLTNNLALNNQQGNFNDLVGGIQGFSFKQRLGAKQAAADAKQAAVCTTQTKTCGFTLWGKGHIRAFSASPNERAINSFSGHTYNLNLGADYQNGIFLFGGLITASQSNVKFTSGSAEGEGKIRTKLTTFSPYVHFRFKSGTELWGSAGFGQGRMRYQSETTDDGFERTDLKYAQVAGGLYQPLKALQKTNLALKVDGYTARLKADAKEDVFLAMAGDVSRVRALLEIEHAWQGAYYSLTSKLNGGARLETGDIGKGIGFEFGVEIAYVNPACGFSVSADINTILLHTAQRYRHLDAGLRLLLDPGTKKRGLQFRLEPRIGGTTSAAPLWDGALVDGSALPVQQLGTSGLGQLQTALGLSYGFAARQSLLTPFTEMRLDDRGAPIDFMLGMRFSRANLPINITLYAQKVFRSGAAGTSLGSDIGAATTPGVHLKLIWK